MIDPTPNEQAAMAHGGATEATPAIPPSSASNRRFPQCGVGFFLVLDPFAITRSFATLGLDGGVAQLARARVS